MTPRPRRAQYTPAPADILLELLREQHLTYRCHEHYGRWTARCPLCHELRLEIREHGDRGRVSARCATGCSSDEILHALRHPERCYSCGTLYGATAEFAHVAGELLGLAHAQQHLLRQAHHLDDLEQLVESDERAAA